MPEVSWLRLLHATARPAANFAHASYDYYPGDCCVRIRSADCYFARLRTHGYERLPEPPGSHKWSMKPVSLWGDCVYAFGQLAAIPRMPPLSRLPTVAEATCTASWATVVRATG